MGKIANASGDYITRFPTGRDFIAKNRNRQIFAAVTSPESRTEAQMTIELRTMRQ